ncbi:MAG: D-alanine--D-alanine ligase [SAR324 cluster bacterium]|nr:D-alanine--D-alanine ligase [SAR324 cluster bacterium]
MKIAVLFGGTSTERDVSIASAAQIVAALRKSDHLVTAVDTAKGILSLAEEEQILRTDVSADPPSDEELAACQADNYFVKNLAKLQEFDVIFFALHGGTGEDGTIQAALDLLGVPYTGTGHMASSIAMDKDIAKRLFIRNEIPTAKWLMAPVSHEEVENVMKYPVVVKPNNQGSTIGLTIVKHPQGLETAIETAYHFSDEVMIEQYIPGRELTVGILNDRPLAVGEIFPKGDHFDYESKYQKGGAEEIFPANLGEDEKKRIQELALNAHRALKLKGYSRVDFRMDPDGEFWCLEANTLPGMTSSSLLPQSAKAEGIAFPELCDQICQLALQQAHRNTISPA